MIRVKRTGNFARDARRWLDRLEADAAKAAAATAESCAVDIRRHAPVESGELRDSVRSGSDGLTSWATVGNKETSGEVGWNEYGTSHQPARPFVRPAVDRSEATFRRMLRRVK